MSKLAFAWAFQQGPELGLTSSELLLLLYMADQAKECAGLSFYTGQPTMAKFTRLSLRTVRDLIPQLEGKGLVRVTQTPGKPTLYHLLMQPEGEAATAAPATAAARTNGATPATTAGVPRQPLPPHPGKIRPQPRQNLHVTPAATAGDPYCTQEEDYPKTREDARRAGADSELLQEGGTAPPQPTREAPEFFQTPEEDRVDPAYVARQVAQLTQELAHVEYAPGRRGMTRAEQLETLRAQRPRPYHLPTELLNQMPHRQRALAAVRRQGAEA